MSYRESADSQPEVLPTPVTPAERTGRALGVDLHVKRDDLTQLPGGGSKMRKLRRILLDAEFQGADALVTTGGVQSNHARVTALEAAARGWACSLVLHGDPGAVQAPSGNLLLCILAGARVSVVEPGAIADALATAAAKLRAAGRVPFVVPGGGHCLAGALAYADAVRELAGQCSAWRPEWIVLASGTGTTQAGILAGLHLVGWDTRVVGASIARRNPRGTDVVRGALAELTEHLGLEGTQLVDFRDDWVGRGYEQADRRVFDAIAMAASSDGLILDPTYTGKAFLGLVDMVRSGEIPQGSRVLFWHTGGLLNLMAADPAPFTTYFGGA